MRKLREIVSPKAAKPKKKGKSKSSVTQIPVASPQAPVAPKRGKAKAASAPNPYGFSCAPRLPCSRGSIFPLRLYRRKVHQ